MATTPAFAYDGAVWPRGSFPTFFPLESALGIFGDRLRKQREQRGISLEAVSATTKIGIRMLRAIEDEHFDQLPGGVFNKGFIRAYARHVGLDEDEIIAEYLAVQQESQLQSQAIQPDFRQPTAKPLQPGSNFAGASSHPDTRIEDYRAE